MILTIAIFLAVLLAFILAPTLSQRFGKKKGAISLFLVGFVICSVPAGAQADRLVPGKRRARLVPTLFGLAPSARP